MKTVPFNIPAFTGEEYEYIKQAVYSQSICGGGLFSKKCQKWFEENFKARMVLLTNSCTSALEMSAILADIKKGDEVIMPSYTFVSTANAFVLRGAKIVFVDIRPDNMNIDEQKIETAITKRTKAIVPVHYAGVSCEMDTILAIAKKHNLYVIEDAAQAVMATYKNKPLGTIGDIGCYSFHETKNYTSGGEGGAILINSEKFIKRAEMVHEKGTDRKRFFQGQVDKYTWQDVGSSFLPSEIQGAYLFAQLENAQRILKRRLDIWQKYHMAFEVLEKEGKINRPVVSKHCKHSGHIYYVKLEDFKQRCLFIEYLKQHNVQATFHYVPLHTSPAGLKFGRFDGKDEHTTSESGRIVRLPIFYNMTDEELAKSIEATLGFFKR